MAYKDPRDITFKPGCHADKFERAARPDNPKFGNGSGWARDDGGLAKKYKLVKRKDEHNRIVSVQLAGFAEPSFVPTIPQSVYDHHKGKPCVVLATSKTPEMDHKDGRKHSFKPVDSNDEFQPMSKAANDAKRSHCKRCAATNIRFDATKLGYPVPVISGTIDYRGTCEGCYWFDPLAFNSSFKLP